MYFLFNPALRSRLCFRSALAYLQISLFTFPFVSSTPSPSGAPPVSGGERMAVQFSVFTFHLSVCIIHPLPFGRSPCLRGRKLAVQFSVFTFPFSVYIAHLSQGEKG